MKIAILTTCLLCLSLLAHAGEETEVELPDAPSPEYLAETSEVILLVQLIGSNYEYRRDFPISGKAWLRTLISYKAPRRIDRFAVHEEGLLKDNACYFPDVPQWQEMPRFLVFLRIDENGDFRGNPAGCMLHVLVNEDSQYVVRWPQEHLHLDDDALDKITEYRFTGPAARVPTRDMTRMQAERMQEEYTMRREGDYLVYTRGIELSEFRQLMGPAAVDEERTRRR